MKECTMATFTEFEKNIIERIDEQMAFNKEKPELGNIDLEKGIELIRDAGAILLT